MRERETLLRIVRTPEGEIKVDVTGKAQGRGCYVCKSAACIQKGVKTRFINRAFKCVCPQEVYQEVLQYASEQ
jgi:hypothetical protein